MKGTITVLLLLFSASAVKAVPVVPNFTQGAMTSRTETSSQVTETINSINYNTGYQYVITGTNLSHDGDTMLFFAHGLISRVEFKNLFQ